MTLVAPPEPVIPDYAGPCVSNIVPALLEHTDAGRPWMPEAALTARQVVVLVVDGLGADQLADRAHLAPTLAALTGAPITTVAPSTTAAALTSIATGAAPSQHGVVGYRVRTGGETLNVLRWSTGNGDARNRISPAEFQPLPVFADRHPVVVSRAEFVGSGFTLAHLAGTNYVGYRLTSTLLTEVARALTYGVPFVYAYYDGIDRVGHEFGLGENYDNELVTVDRLVADLLDVLPPGAALVITADHGQVEVDDRVIEPDAEVLRHVHAQSGEARFRWLHAVAGRAGELADAATAAHGDHAWVFTLDQVLDLRLLGPRPAPGVLDRLGDVALIPFEPIAFSEPSESTSIHLIGRHGSLTSAEMRVPLLVGAAP